MVRSLRVRRIVTGYKATKKCSLRKLRIRASQHHVKSRMVTYLLDSWTNISEERMLGCSEKGISRWYRQTTTFPQAKDLDSITFVDFDFLDLQRDLAVVVKNTGS